MQVIEGIPTAEIVPIPQSVFWRECPGCLIAFTQSSVVERALPNEDCPKCGLYRIREFIPLDDNRDKVAVIEKAK